MIVVASFLTLATPNLSFVTPTLAQTSFGRTMGSLYLSMDPSDNVPFIENQPALVEFEFYLMVALDFGDIGKPELNNLDGLAAWEASLDIPEAVTVTRRVTTPLAINVGKGADNWVVGLPEMLAAWTTPAVLVTYTAVLLSEGQSDLVITIHESTPTTFEHPDAPAQGPGWLEWYPIGECEFSSRIAGNGCLRAFERWAENRLVLNCVTEQECTSTVAEGASWGAIKARFAGN